MLKALRPAHWVKNFIVLAPAFFSGQMGSTGLLCQSLLAFAVFCGASSTMYLFNDLYDVESDRAHGSKSRRPLAAGQFGAGRQRLLIAGAAGATVAGCFAVPWGVAGMVAAYWLGMALYTVVFKKIWPLGVAMISLGMIARIFAGAAAIDVCVSAWVLPCAFLLTAYVVTGKRLYDGEPGAREAWAQTKVFYLCGLATLGFYMIYCFVDVTIQKYNTRWIILTALPVLAGLWRYARLVHIRDARREHLLSILLDPVITACLAIWLLIFSLIIYVK